MFEYALSSDVAIGTNHSELIWKYRETAHYKIIYHQNIEKLAEQAAIVAEEVYQPILTDLACTPSSKIVIIISDYDDISNGIAYPLGHYVFIWAKNFTKYTTGRMKWLRRVIAHELTHQFNYLCMRNFLGTPWELLSLATTPTWFIEGIAQYEAERWDVHRDMFLRVAAKDHALLPRKKLEGFIGTDQIDSRLIYEQGHSLVRYIANKYGAEKIREILKKHRQLPISFNLAMKRAIGISEKTVIRDWNQQLQNHYQTHFQNTKQLKDSFSSFQDDLQAVYAIRWAPGGDLAAVVGVESYTEQITRLYLYRADGKRLKELDGPHIGSYFSWSPDGKHLVYSKLRKSQYSSIIHDLFTIEVETGERETLTRNLRATDPCWSPDGNEIVFCQHQGPYSNLVIYNLEKQNVTPISSFENWTDVFSPVWKPDGSQIAFSYFGPDGTRDLALIRRDGSEFVKLTNDSTDSRTPAWSPDGKRIAYISYQNGTPNLWMLDLDDFRNRQLTDVHGGLFNPTWMPDGKSISVVAFEQRDSVHVYTLTLTQLPESPLSRTLVPRAWHKMTPPNVVSTQISYKPQATILYNSIPENKYHGLSHVRSQLIFPNIGLDDAGYQAGIYNISADPLNKHQFIWSVTRGKRTHYFFDYTNRVFLPLFHFYSGQTSNNSGLFFGERLWEKSTRFSLRLDFPINFGQNILANHRLWLGFDAMKISNYNPAKFQQFPEWAKPFSGWLSGMSVGYGYFNIHPSLTSNIHPDRGFLYDFRLRRNSQAFGSDLTATQFSMALVLRFRGLWRRHILASRFGQFLHEGEQRVQSRYAVGTSMLRGLEPSVEGSRMIYSNLDYRFPIFQDLGLKLWFFYFEKIYGAFFLDLANVWGSHYTYSTQNKRYFWAEKSFNNRDVIGTFGTELRLRLFIVGKLSFVFRGGMAKQLNTDSKKIRYFYLLGPVF